MLRHDFPFKSQYSKNKIIQLQQVITTNSGAESISQKRIKTLVTKKEQVVVMRKKEL